MIYVCTVQSVRYHIQVDIGAGPHPGHHGGGALAHDGMETVHTRLEEHARNAAAAG